MERPYRKNYTLLNLRSLRKKGSNAQRAIVKALGLNERDRQRGRKSRHSPQRKQFQQRGA